MKQLIVGCALYIAGLAVQAQVMVTGEYYVDTDPGLGQGTPLVFDAGDSISFTFTVDLNEMEEGFHRLYVRFLTDSSDWSLAEPRTFYVGDQPVVDHSIVRMEWFIDEDPGVGLASTHAFSLPADSVNQAFVLPFEGLDPGFHSVSVRIQNAEGQWSIADRRIVYVTPQLQQDLAIVSGEFFVDTEPGVGNGTPFTIDPADSLNSTVPLLMPELPLGGHMLYVRTKNAAGQWSLLEPRPFTVCETYGAYAEANFTEQGNMVLFDGTTAFADSLVWNLGDGTITETEDPLHTYSEAGVYTVSLFATNNCGSTTSEVQVTIEGLESVYPSQVAQGSVATLTLHGFGFVDGSTVQLSRVGFDPIEPLSVTVVDPYTLEAVVSFAGQETGWWDTEVDIPLAGLYALPASVEIVATNYTNEGIVMSSIQVAAQRTGRRTPAAMHIRNDNLMDLVAVPVVFRDIADVEQMLYAEEAPLTEHPFFIGTYEYLLDNGISNTVMEGTAINTATNSALMGLLIPRVNASASYDVPFFIRRSVDGTHKRGSLMVYPQLDATSLAGDLVYMNEVCMSEFVRVAVESETGAGLDTGQWNECYAHWNDSLYAAILDFASDGTTAHQPLSMPACITSVLVHMQQEGCVTGFPDLNAGQYKSIAAHVMANMVFLNDAEEVALVCPQFQGMHPSDFQEMSYPGDRDNEFCELAQEVGGFALLSSAGQAKAWCTLFGSGVDPNVKYGPGDNAADIYVMPGDLAPYDIAFENLSTASAPVEEVIIVDSLDVTRFDLASFRWGLIALGDSIIVAPDEVDREQLLLQDLRPGLPYFLLSQLSLDTISGIARWQFTTLDTTNLQPLEVGIGGFLPPNTNGTEGLGDVTFFVRFGNDLVTGDSIRNRASIYFDFNDPIMTPHWLNVVDMDPPMSAVDDLPATTPSETFMVTWMGVDDPAGVANYTVYVSENDGPFVPWIVMTDTLQSQFTGTMGSVYKFYSVAVDNAGNWEAAPEDPPNEYDAITLLAVGVEETEFGEMLTVYPSPADDLVHFNLLLQENAEVKYALLDAQGKLVIPEATARQRSGRVSGTLDVSECAAGAYLLRVQTSATVHHVRVVIR